MENSNTGNSWSVVKKDRVENFKMLNFLFCYDSNYNKQAEVAMYSILENVSEKININIIHQTDKVKKFNSKHYQRA